MKRSVKSTISMILIFAALFSMFVMPAQAAVPEENETKALIYTYYVSRADCKEIYNELPEAKAWTTIVKDALYALVTGDVISLGTAAIDAIVTANYKSARNAFYNGGYVSGYTGCKILVYDNGTPTVLAY